ncbi:response regulator [Sphingomonas oligophenolica]|uniref:protein-glutamate methylesterase n=2 Tax=Sphingomonas oligophenolica TaxID=301154 RepID=A0A502CGW1_9SPHN|nr:chemotaxis protein CheB [Sphingomonas oligophenolica]TPG12208.1 response regulator [Sphingomonas oligophenolica]
MPLSVLIVDDSAVARAVIAKVIDQSAEFRVAHSVGTVAAALHVLGDHRVDFILLDLALPGVDGLTALPDLVAAARGARVVVVSSTAIEGAAVTIQALALGAAETVLKPATGDSTSAFGIGLLKKMRRLVEPRPRVDIAPRIAPRPVSTPVSAPAPLQRFEIVAIGASTGGIHALSLLLRALPRSFVTPIVITQHLPGSFMPYFAAQLALLSGRPCDVAVDRLRIRPGRIVLAPGDAHIRGVALPDGGAAVRLTGERVANGCLPSVDPMFASLAAVYGPALLAVVLSGMGRDGVDGAVAVQRAGGCVIVQNEASSVVWGMPGAIAATGIAAAVLDPEALGHLIASGRHP